MTPRSVTSSPFVATDWITNIIMVLIIFIYLTGGSFTGGLIFRVLATPIFYPAVIESGFDLIWFGIMIGVIIPPAAIAVFAVKNMTGEPCNCDLAPALESKTIR